MNETVPSPLAIGCVPRLKVPLKQLGKGPTVSFRPAGGVGPLDIHKTRAGKLAAACDPAHNRSAHDGCSAMPASARMAGTGRCPELSPVSQLFLGMGDATPDIYAIMRLRGHPTAEQVAVSMRKLAEMHDRFRMRVVCRGGTWCTEILEEFDVRWCMREVTLDGDDIDEAFNGFVAKLMSGAPLSEGALPPWDCSVVHFASDPDHTDVLLRCSHMIGDGQLFMQLLSNVLEEYEDDGGDSASASASAADPESEECASPASGSARGSGFSGGRSSPASSAAGSGAGSGDGSASGGAASSRGGRSGAGGGPALIRAVRPKAAFPPPPSLARKASTKSVSEALSVEGPAPERRSLGLKEMALRILTQIWSWFTSAIFTVMLPFRLSDPVNSVKAGPDEIHGPRAFSSITLSLDEMKQVSKVVGVTINTLAVSCIAGGLRRFLLHQAEKEQQQQQQQAVVRQPSLQAFGSGRIGGATECAARKSGCGEAAGGVPSGRSFRSSKSGGPGAFDAAPIDSIIDNIIGECQELAPGGGRKIRARKSGGGTGAAREGSCSDSGAEDAVEAAAPRPAAAAAGAAGAPGAKYKLKLTAWQRVRKFFSRSDPKDPAPRTLLLCSMVDTRAMRRAKGTPASAAASGAAVGSYGCNTLSFIGVPVLTGAAQPLERLAAVSRSLEWIRSGIAILMAMLMPPVIQFFVRDAHLASHYIVALLPSKTSLGFSNMRGPVKRVALQGFKVERMYNGVQPNAFGTFISLMSYDNQVTIVNSCYTCKSQHPEELLACIREEWEALKAAAEAKKAKAKA